MHSGADTVSLINVRILPQNMQALILLDNRAQPIFCSPSPQKPSCSFLAAQTPYQGYPIRERVSFAVYTQLQDVAIHMF